MKPLSKKTRLLVYIGLLFVFIVLTALSLPRQISALQTTLEPTPTITPIFIHGEEPLKSGETGGLMVGAAIILLIIVAGVVTHRIIQRINPDTSD
jgi:multisubunit Na+/H+ antiporter MnhB subunit